MFSYEYDVKLGQILDIFCEDTYAVSHIIWDFCVTS